MVPFKDHHFYSEGDVISLVEKAKSRGAVLVTTEKDIVKFRDKEKIKLLDGISLFYLAIEHQFLKDGNVFDDLVKDAIKEKYKPEEEE